MSHKIIRLPEVIDMTGLSRSTIYLRMSKGSFPQSISLGDRAIGWVQVEVEQWLEQRISASRNAGGQHD
ncbi:helix-turn-helix transcriptional regulator [Vibrio sinaloensis]|uniref:AlpA family transcriptional regulator n=1 Tax=Photobacterium sp. (strain ATCC 43367) TaxID=379097 RepID=A0A0A5HUG6_PHOS4|nr:AlpA family transcriptional regulator [Vibrio sinaloensis]KGY09202.1 AlpA family transcriptional regulator [Vibrio sinaloensis]HDY7733559.1 AlpA family transcriptional regulator [Vibrio vulnificus]